MGARLSILISIGCLDPDGVCLCARSCIDRLFFIQFISGVCRNAFVPYSRQARALLRSRTLSLSCDFSVNNNNNQQRHRSIVPALPLACLFVALCRRRWYVAPLPMSGTETNGERQSKRIAIKRQWMAPRGKEKGERQQKKGRKKQWNGGSQRKGAAKGSQRIRSDKKEPSSGKMSKNLFCTGFHCCVNEQKVSARSKAIRTAYGAHSKKRATEQKPHLQTIR